MVRRWVQRSEPPFAKIVHRLWCGHVLSPAGYGVAMNLFPRSPQRYMGCGVAMRAWCGHVWTLAIRRAADVVQRRAVSAARRVKM
eukprot:43231-Chlamydomonas_euryale.AAC.2